MNTKLSIKQLVQKLLKYGRIKKESESEQEISQTNAKKINNLQSGKLINQRKIPHTPLTEIIDENGKKHILLGMNRLNQEPIHEMEKTETWIERNKWNIITQIAYIIAEEKDKITEGIKNLNQENKF